jgi:predicted transcriptional regulator
MSKAGVLAALKSGPKTTAQILQTTGTSSGDVSRSCSELRLAGLIKRVDGQSGKGSKAIYALADYEAVAAFVPKHRLTMAQVFRSEIPDSLTYVHRDPCIKCGTRRDVGCKHVRAA